MRGNDRPPDQAGNSSDFVVGDMGNNHMPDPSGYRTDTTDDEGEWWHREDSHEWWNSDDDDACSEDELVTDNTGCCHDEVMFFKEIGQISKDGCGYMCNTIRKMNIGGRIRKKCSLASIKSAFPILTWLPKYRLAELQGDLIAGMTVGLTVIPQSIAYASIAAVPPQYGLYSAFIGSFVYVVFGSAKDITLGPSAIMSLLTAQFGLSPIAGDATYAIVLGLFTGIIQIAMWALSFGFLTEFISFPVIKAFTSAAAITIGMSQVKVWLGEKGVPREFLSQLYWTIKKLPETKLWDFALGVICIIFIILLRRLKEMRWKKKFRDMPTWQKVLKKFCWFVGTARNVIIIAVASLVAGLLYKNLNLKLFTLTGFIQPGLPKFQVPKFSVQDTKPGSNVTYTFTDITQEIGAGFVVLPILGLLEALSIAKPYARRGHYKFYPNQELLAYGVVEVMTSQLLFLCFIVIFSIANTLQAFVSGYPGTGTFSRTAVNFQSGVKTPAGGIVTGVIVLLSLQFLTPYLYYIPSASLAVVIIMAVLDMITFHKVSVFWTSNKLDLLPWFVTFIMSFILGLQYGVAIGAALSLFLLLYSASRPMIKVKKHHVRGQKTGRVDGRVIVVELTNALMYPAVEFIQKQMERFSHNGTDMPKGIVLDLSHVHVIDATAVQGIRQMFEEFNKKEITLVLSSMQENVERVLLKSKLKHYLHARTVKEAIEIIFGIQKSENEQQNGTYSQK